MQHWSKTRAGTPRFFCSLCRKTTTWKRKDALRRHVEQRFVAWLTGMETKTEIAKELGVSRRALTKRFHPLFANPPISIVPKRYRASILIVDGAYAHGTALCVLVALDEEDRIFWMFAERERKASWKDFLSRFPEPDVVVGDAQKGLYYAVRDLWGEDVDFQRCQFHVIQLIHRYLTRTPKEEAAKELLRILGRLKDVKTKEEARAWRLEYGIWEGMNQQLFKEKRPDGRYKYPKLRSARTAMRKAVPHLFVFLDHPGVSEYHQ